MSGIVLSASVRQNLLSLQSTASLLATTQNDLATGNRVNSALDNPTEYFTAQGLNNRAGDISNLLDGINNGVQVLQAANTGITALQGLIASAQSVANQVLQASTGYSTKSSVTATAITGATANNLLGPSSASTTAAGTAVNNNLTTPAPITPATLLAGGANTDSLGATVTDGSTITVDGKTITFSTSTSTTSTDANGNVTIGIGAGSTANVQAVLNAIDNITGATGTNASSVGTGANAGKITLGTGTTQNLVLGGTALAAFGLTAGTTNLTPPALSGKTLTITPTNGSTAQTNITFGTGSGQISTLNQLNAALAANDLQAGIDSTGTITITTTNNAASETVGTFSGSAVGAGPGAIFATGAAGLPPVADPNSQATRAGLVAQYNQVLQNITTTAQDASFNGINLLNGDTLNLTFDETGNSKLAIQGFTFNVAGLGLAPLTAGTDFLDSNSANAVLTQLTAADTTLRTAASQLGSNLSVVQIRQDFNKNLVNVLQTGATNLTIADPNEEAANSQALSTRQSIAVSALALANQSQQSVLQLLR